MKVLLKTVFVLLMLVVSSRTFCQDAETYYNMAEDKIKNGDYQYALILIEKAIVQSDTNVWYQLKRGDILFELNGPMNAVAYLKTVAKKFPTVSEAYNRIGMYYNSAGYVDSAILLYNKAISLAEKDTTKYMFIQNRGTAKAGIRDFKGALEDYEAVLRFDSTDIGTLNNIAPVYRELGQIDNAIKSLNKLIGIDSMMIGTYINLGFIYSKQDSIEKAISYFNKALKIDPKEPLVYNNRGYCYYKIGEYTKALNDINLSIKLYPTNSYAYRNLALVYIATDNLKEACTSLGYAEYYGFAKHYGPEVTELKRKYCEK